MKIIDSMENDMIIRIPDTYKAGHNLCEYLFFDIETTGFAARNTTLYLIGVFWQDPDGSHIRQWFNEDGASEEKLLRSFVDFCSGFTCLVHFNGLLFDLPYLKEKAAHYGISFASVDSMQQLDIYYEIRKYRKLFPIENMKQRSIEEFLGIHRPDLYTGKELIHIYQRYVAKPEEKAEEILLLHNHDDVLGMPDICRILQYVSVFEENADIPVVYSMDEASLLCRMQYPVPFPAAIHTEKNGMQLDITDPIVQLRIPITQTVLKHYFADYKNYYYLPKEDTALHKSVACYVETGNRIKATRETCYIKKEDRFIPCYLPTYTESFQSSSRDKQTFMTLDAFLQLDAASQNIYIRNAFKSFL